MYLQVSGIGGDSVLFFVSYIRPFKSLTSKTLSRWIKVVLTSAGVDSNIWKPHSVRSASATHQTSTQNLDLGQICRLVNWSLTSGVYKKFYQCYM